MNISQLAKELNLSVSTVSRVLSGNSANYRISQKTIERVKEAAARLNVIPNPLGSSLQRGSTGMLGLIIPDITNPFFATLARNIEKELRKHGKALLLCDSAESLDTERRLLKDMMARRLDGLIIAPTGIKTNEIMQAVSNPNCPAVIIDRIIPELPANSVSLDNAEAGIKAVEELVKHGHTRIGCLRGDMQTFVDSERFRGIITGFRANDIEMNPLWIAGDGYTLESGITGATTILEQKSRPTAIITLNGQAILGLLNAATTLGFNIPKELSIIAFDDQPWSNYLNPPVTTVAQPIDEIARKTVELIIEENSEKTQKSNYSFSAKIIERASITSPLI